MSSITMSPSVVASAAELESSVSRRRVARVGLLTVVASVLANLVVYFAGDAVVGYNPDFVVLSNASGAVIFTFAAAIGAVLVYAALLRFTRNPARVFTIVSAVVFVATTVPDFTYIPSVEGASNGQTAVLVLMHIVAALVIVRMLTSLNRPRTR